MSSYTIDEIFRQPETWRKIPAIAKENAERLRDFLSDFLDVDGQMILAGAGSSEYIGRTLQPYISRNGKHAVCVCGTTDIVTFPKSCVSAERNTLMVSFARSGDSPESIGAIRAAEAVSSRLRHLILTCNRNGKLFELGTGNSAYHVIALPDETNDLGFAMTNSFTSIYLTALLCLVPEKLSENATAVQDIAEAGERFLGRDADALVCWANGCSYNRIVYLGTEALKGLAQESALKMLELTRGRTATLYDSPVGFRHGPKSFVNDETLVVIYLSDDSFVRKYELDLLREMSRERRKNRILVVSGRPCPEADTLADYYYCFNNAGSYENGLLAPEFLLVAQMLAFNKSLALQIDPDNPNPAGTVNRVVQGVTIYPYGG
ncbi:MAG: SIS domain-containing protein [Oscillospiraceae bacterium]|nr:SIS domain-containing protein [Oscillospiraceae bacterium]